jgi:hypothetical protein
MSVVAGCNVIGWNIVNRNVSPGLTVKEKLTRTTGEPYPDRAARHRTLQLPVQYAHLRHLIVTISRCPDRRKILTTTVAPCLITSKSIELWPTFKSRILTRCRDSGRQG